MARGDGHDECRKRIEELEADYRNENEGRRAIEALWTEQKARAEKAEKALEAAYVAGAYAVQERDIAKARVAELHQSLEMAREMLRERGINLVGP